MQERCSTCRRACDRGEKKRKLSTLTRSETRSDGKRGEDVPEKACGEEEEDVGQVYLTSSHFVWGLSPTGRRGRHPRVAQTRHTLAGCRSLRLGMQRARPTHSSSSHAAVASSRGKPAGCYAQQASYLTAGWSAGRSCSQHSPGSRRTGRSCGRTRPCCCTRPPRSLGQQTAAGSPCRWAAGT